MWGRGEELVITAPLPEGESENIPNKIDRISVTLKTQKTTQRVVFCNDKSMPNRDSNYEGESDYYGSDASIPVELEISKSPIVRSSKN
ncbi:hypothetical protein HRED_10602 [Candidatus Haloredivivus sp. G17]|nr:hypothetical protein HRED_10602 [Candidatus Haloredivivus sp. G17]